MRRLIVARYVGDDDAYYKKGNQYPLSIKTRLFSKKVSIFKTRGYLNQCDQGSEREFPDMRAFITLFKPIPQRGDY